MPPPAVALLLSQAANGCPAAKGFAVFPAHCVGPTCTSAHCDCGPTLASGASCPDASSCVAAASAACTADAKCTSFSLLMPSDCAGGGRWQTYAAAGGGVVSNSDWVAYARADVPTPPPTPAPPPPGACASDIDCSLNGACTGGRCACDKPWSGLACETMGFKPVTFPQGYGMSPNLTTWGGNTIYDAATKKYHMYVSAMTNGCPLSTWGHNSRIDHAVADTVTGPYAFKDVAVPTWSHNAAPIALHDGTYAIVHIGGGDGPADGGQNCTHGAVAGAAAYTSQDKRAFIDGLGAGGGSTIHVSKSLDGPWAPLSPNTLGGCNNPAPWVHPNGTIYIVCGGSFKRAESISGPWTTVASFSHSGGPSGNYEDPFLYTDARGYHLLYHVYNTHEHPPHGHECFDSTVSAHVYSVDGYTWHTSPTQPYGTQVELTTGETVTIATRERPKMWFNAAGQKTHLINGVCSAPACPNGPATGCVDCKYANWDYTLVQPLAV